MSFWTKSDPAKIRPARLLAMALRLAHSCHHEVLHVRTIVQTSHAFDLVAEMQSTTDTTAQQHATSIQAGTTTTQHYTQHFKLFLYIKMQSNMLAPPHCQVLTLQKAEASSPPHCKGRVCRGASMLD